MTTHQRCVVIGVDARPGSTGALRYGLGEARLLDAPVRLVHVVPDYVPVSLMMPLTPADLTATGTAVLEQSEAQARGLAPDLTIEGELRHGARAAELCRAAETASLVVVGRDARPALERLMRGNTATGVAAHAAVPSVSVPADWQPVRHDRVVVGVKSSHHAAAVLGDAFAAASERDARLVVLHAWYLPSQYDDLVQARTTADEWTSRSKQELENAIRDLRREYPHVDAETRVVHGHPVPALLAASAEADLLILARRSQRLPGVAQLGGTARSVLRVADCPIRVVSRQSLRLLPGLVLEEAGTLDP